MTIETTHILLKRGNTAQSLTYTGPSGEVTVDTDLDSLRVHDGVTPGGTLLSGDAINGNRLVNGVRTLTLEATGNITAPAFTIPNSVGTNGQVLKWPSSGSTLVWGADSSTTNQLVNGAHTVSLGATGKLTFPDSATLAVGSAAEIDALALVYTDFRDQLTDAFAGASYTGDGAPADFTSYNRLTASADPDIQPSWIVLAKAAEDAYVAMLTAQQAISFNIDIYGRQWTFTSDREHISNSLLIPENTTISGPDSIVLRADGNSNKEARLDLDAANNRVSIGTTNRGWVFSNDGILSLPTVGKIGNGAAEWTFSEGGTLTVPSPNSNPFLLTFAATNYVATGPKPTLALTSAPWTVEGQYVYAANGESQLTLGAIGPNLLNPGYAVGDVFTFEAYGADDQANHGIIGYTVTIEIISITSGPSGFTASVTESPAPEYPSTILTNGAIKLTTNPNTSWIFGTDGTLTLPAGGDIKDSTGNSVLGGGAGDSITNGGHSVSIASNGVVTMSTSRGTLEFGALPEPGGTQHFHIMKGAGQDGSGGMDLYFGDDYNYVLQRPASYQGSPAYGVEIGANDLDGGDQHVWRFGTDGDLAIPPGKTIRDAMTGDDLLAGGGTAGDANIWVQTFETQNGAPTDIVSLAISVEYDDAGNVIALFNHFNDDGGGSYYSVGKYTTTGAKIWTARFDDEFYTDGWGLAVDNDSNSIYVAGETDVEGQDNATLTKLDSTDGSVLWSKIYDFGFSSQSSVVDVASDGDPVMVGYASNGTDDYVATTKVDAADGSIIWSRALDGQADEEAYGMAVGPTGEVVAIGYMEQLDETVSHSVTPLTGSATNILVINRSDLSGDILTDTWEVAGTGITGTIGVNAINVYTGLTGTVRQGSGADFTVTDNGNGTYTAQAAIAGTNYLPGHKIKILGTDLGGATPANDCTITIDTITLSGGIVDVSNSGTAAGTEIHVYFVSGTNFETGSGLTFNFFGDSGSTYTEHPTEITAVGTNYVLDDVITISGALLGGTSPTNDLIGTVNANLGGVVQFMSFSGTQQTTTYRVRTEDGGPDFGGVGTWTLSGTVTDTDNRMLIIKYLSDGTIDWQKAILFDEGFDCRGADADIDSAGNIYVTGSYQYSFDGGTTSALSILKLDGTGAKQWSRRVVGECDTFGVSVVVGADDKLYLSAMTGKNDTPDEYIWVAAKYGIDGTVEWQRLIDNTTGWSFTGDIFFADGGGSNIAVKDGYVLLGGGFGDLPNSGDPQATLIQVAAAGDVFSVGDWDFKAASFSGLLNGSASDITVVNAEKTDTDNAENITTGTVTLTTEVSGFLLGTLYSTTANNRLFNGSNQLVLESTGTLTLPSGGTITEGYVTSNPTIQLTPASPSVASQKLVIKGGTNYIITDNGITLLYQFNTALPGATLDFYIDNAITYANQTLYWWIYPEAAGLTTPSSGTIALNGSGNSGEESISFVVDSDAYEFTVRVSPENNNYDPANVGVESGLINADEPTFEGDHHLHLTTGNLEVTSIFLGTDDHNVRTTVDGGISMTTTRGTVLFGNTPDNPVTGSSHFHIMKDSPDIVDLFFGDDDNYVKLPSTQGVEISANGSTWQFGTDSTLTLPGNSSVGEVTPATGAAKNVIVIQSASSILNTSFASLPPAPINNYNVPGTGIVVNVTWNTNGEDYHAPAFVVVDGGTGHTGGGESGGGDVLTVPYVDMGISGGGNWTWYVVDIASDVVLTAGLESWTFGGNGDTEFPNNVSIISGGASYRNITGDNGISLSQIGNGNDGSSNLLWYGATQSAKIQLNRYGAGNLAKVIISAEGTGGIKTWTFDETGTTTLPGTVVNSTVAKTGIAYNTGTATALEDSTYIGSIVDGSYGPFTRGLVTFTVVVTSGVAAYTVTATTGNTAVGAVIGTLDTGDLGGTSGSTSNISVADVVQGVTAIDLTKTINKLTDGYYYLADGVEGQIMYVVRQNGSTAANIFVEVANARWDGSVYSDQPVIPFQIPFTDMVTIIFTDGAWQSSTFGSLT